MDYVPAALRRPACSLATALQDTLFSAGGIISKHALSHTFEIFFLFLVCAYSHRTLGKGCYEILESQVKKINQSVEASFPENTLPSQMKALGYVFRRIENYYGPDGKGWFCRMGCVAYSKQLYKFLIQIRKFNPKIYDSLKHAYIVDGTIIIDVTIFQFFKKKPRSNRLVDNVFFGNLDALYDFFTKNYESIHWERILLPKGSDPKKVVDYLYGLNDYANTLQEISTNGRWERE